jgi:Leucine-rich repeat (LRR) protein
MCHFNFPRIELIDLFSKSLTSLCLIAQDIKVISGLETCTQLESLWVCETKVSKIEGLDLCTKLVNLYLYDNKIKQIEGLSALTKLQRLWLFDNGSYYFLLLLKATQTNSSLLMNFNWQFLEISEIENISFLNHLEDLHLANNKISLIGDSLIHNHKLSSLNIAGNLIYSFRDVLNLEKLPNLTTLTLNDPTYAENPICALTNYQTHFIYNMRNLLRIDALEVTKEARNAIISTVMKKRM